MRKALLSLFFAVLVSAPLTAQEFKGTILGRITDASGAVVPGAKITVTNQETNVAIDVESNAEGNYVAPFLLPGTYKVAVTARGFRQILREGIIVQVNDKIALNFALEVGAVGEVVTVRAESPMLQTASVDLGQVADRAFMDDALLNSTVLQLANMAPGVLAGGSLGFGGTMGNGQNEIAVNGGNGTQKGNDVTIDGSPALAPRQSGLAVGIPMTDAVQEFKVSPEPARWSWLRGPSQWSQTITLAKSIAVAEGWKVELRALANSPFNHPSFDNPSMDLTSPATFGVITGASGTRTITFGAKLKL